MVQIRWLKEAKEDLKSIYEYISKDSSHYAAFQVEKIKNKVGILKLHPLAGKRIVEIDNPDFREIIEGEYRIIYKVINENLIHVLLVHHGARSLEKRI
jgi:toxin ParE1/3/4